ncbi:vacuolar-type H+-ATPase subunit I/STV1 [Mesorhizobium jarvisii]
MARMSDDQRTEKVIKKLQAAIAELRTVQSLFHSQRRELKQAVLDIEDQLKSIRSLWDEDDNH